MTALAPKAEVNPRSCYVGEVPNCTQSSRGQSWVQTGERLRRDAFSDRSGRDQNAMPGLGAAPRSGTSIKGRTSELGQRPVSGEDASSSGKPAARILAAAVAKS